MGIEPTSSAWKAEVLPLNYTRADGAQSAGRTSQARVHPRSGGGGRIRTFEGVSRQIYSLLPLAAWVPLHKNEPRILISGCRSVNASWPVICLGGGRDRKSTRLNSSHLVISYAVFCLKKKNN